MTPPHDAAHHAAMHRRRVVVGVIKAAVAVGILAYLLFRLQRDDVFQRLIDEPKNWGALAVAQVLVLTGISLNYIRWFLLVRALGLDFRLSDAFRLGSIGMLINQVLPAGSIGGDLFKAVFIAREQPEKRTEAVATVVIDRLVGFYAMTLVASAGYLLGAPDAGARSGAMESLGRIVVGLSIGGTVVIALLLSPLFANPKARTRAEGVPKIGGTLVRLVDAATAYREHRASLLVCILMSCCTHTVFVTSFWFIGRGLPIDGPELAKIFVVGPMSLAAAAMPLTPGGLGVFETALDALYVQVGAPKNDGVLVALTYRVMTYVMAAIGAVYYVSARRTVSQVMHEAEELADDLEDEILTPES
jgi:uncharacterized membrane protein YbhN (UPF0104 family)